VSPDPTGGPSSGNRSSAGSSTGDRPAAGSSPGTRPSGEAPPLLGNWLSRLEDHLSRCEHLTLCLDFDGTLAPIAEDPDAAAMPADVERALAALADRPGVEPAVVSGRALSDLRERVDPDVTLAGNHGLEMDRGEREWVHPAAAERRGALERAIGDVAERLAAYPDCRIEDKGVTATVHHRGADADHATVRAAVRTALSDEPALVATEGRKIVEVRPDVEWHKGEAVRELVDDGERASAVYVGDDVTDEDAFEALEDRSCRSVGVLVGDRPSAADYRVHDVDCVRAFLAWLADEVHPAGRPPDGDAGP
jgi:trehalose 6-phosphate phosphatase